MPNKDDSNIHHSIEICPHYAWLILILFFNLLWESQLHESGYTLLWRGRTLDLNFEASFAEQDSYFSSFLPTMASNRTSINYNRELFSRIAEVITCWPCAWALKLADSGRGQNFSLY